MMQGNPQLMAIALLVRKFGKKIPGGGYEVEVSHEEMKELSQYGMFQELPELDQHKVRWQYYPNNTIEGELVTPEALPENTPSPSEASLRPTCGHKSTNQFSNNRCNCSEGHKGDHSYGDSYETEEYWPNTEDK